MNLESIIVVLCIILALPFCIFLEIIIRGKPNNMIHEKERKELLEIYKKEKGL
jgi:hypothetical protein